MQAQRPGDILVVDTDQLFLTTSCSALALTGHMVMTCQSGHEARRQLERMPYDVVLCGWRLPDEDGVALCNWVKANPDLQHVTIGLMIDADADDAWVANVFLGSGHEDEPGGMAAPDDLIDKRVRPSELSVRVQGLLQLRRYREEIDNAVSALMRLAEGVEEQDRRARGHCKRLSVMVVELGHVMGCDEWQITTLERAAYLHDVGKVAIPGAIISKTESLTPREREIIQSHCALGERLCLPVVGLHPVLPIIRHHHERANGTGYPDGLRGDTIPLLAQIFSILDIYDALRMWRPYRQPMNEPQTLEVMRQEVRQGLWNKEIFDSFVECVLPGLDERLDAAHALWPSL
jgi:putative two-component system response regulator